MKFTMTDEGFSTDTAFGTLDISSKDEAGFRPYQLLVSSVAVCSGGVLRKVLEKKRMNVDDITITADVTRNADEANRVEKIHLHFKVKGEGLTKEKLQKSLDVTFANCSMAQSVKDSIVLSESCEIV
ncbi:OsmC family protein [Bacillaceae bacterium SIJ1]|uniref:OsmC family protein n=1 Tax=Litoribacterium kuwaitense TaxID=1398745 RepID=UPI0013EBDF50|nr:OsmC family protein [Litoribacterium kuwaitense]NGP46046.1 OsmC family protein [Litoribacterium kuwaitense]